MTLHINLDFHPGYQPPVASGTYYCITTEGGTLQTLAYSARHRRFNAHDWEDRAQTPIRVRWWAPIPSTIPVPHERGMRILGTEVHVD